MRMTSTGALPRALAAARPPKPPPTITTRGVFDVRSSAPLIELRLAVFINLFLKLPRSEISENLGVFSPAVGKGPRPALPPEQCILRERVYCAYGESASANFVIRTRPSVLRPRVLLADIRS